MNLKKIGCKNCGAEVVLTRPPNFQTVTSVEVPMKLNLQRMKEITIDGILPFSIGKEEYQKEVLKFLSEGDYTPDDILSSSIFESVTGSYIPMWFYSGRYDGNWSASSGYYRTERYMGRDSNGKLVEKSRTVTDWRPSNGQGQGEYSVFGFAGDHESIQPTIADYAHETNFQEEN